MLDWNKIDTVLLDMDGTLIDQRFDNHFFNELIPKVIAERDNISVETVRQRAQELSQRYAGTLDYYCLDFWERQLKLDLRALKQQLPELVTLRAGVENFLQTIQSLNKKIILVTNAHPFSMNYKLDQINIRQYFNRCLSVHELGLPKENYHFWGELHTVEPFTPATTLFIDDNLPMLDSAKAYNIQYLFAIKKPDYLLADKDTGDYYGLQHFSEITPKMPL